MMHRPFWLLISGFLLAALTFTGVSEADESASTQASAAGMSGFPILAWWSIPFSHATEEKYREMADAGFTLCLPPDRGFQENQLHLKLAEKTGIKVIVQDRRLKKDPAAAAEDYKTFPSLAAYHLQDEPNASEFPRLTTVADQLRKSDPAHPSYINLLPTYASDKLLGTDGYESYLKEFLRLVRPAILSYDNYILFGNSFREKEFFKNLWIIRQAALEHRIPFWAFVMATAHGPFPEPGEGELRFQVFSSLAYGARGIQYFTYWTPSGRPDHEFRGGPVDPSGLRTPVYDLARRINADLHGFAETVNRLTSTGVYLTPPLPQGDSALFHSGFLPGAIKLVSGDPAVLGSFRDFSGNEFVLIVNRSPRNSAAMSLKFSDQVKQVLEIPASVRGYDAAALNGHRVLSLQLNPGDGRLFQIDTETK